MCNGAMHAKFAITNVYYEIMVYNVKNSRLALTNIQIRWLISCIKRIISRKRVI